MGITLNDAPKGIVVMQRCEDGSWKKLGEVSYFNAYDDFEAMRSEFRAEGFICNDDSEYVLDKRENVSYSATFEVKPSEDVLEFFKMALGDSAQSKRSKYRASLPKKVIVSGPCVICIWQDGTKTISRCHDGDEMDVRTGVMLCAIKRWMPGGSYWLDVMDDVEVEYQGKLKKVLKKWKKKATRDVASGDCEPVVERKPKPTDPYHRGLAYSDDEKLAALEMMEGGLSAAEVSRRTGISRATLSNWKREYRGPGKDNCRE